MTAHQDIHEEVALAAVGSRTGAGQGAVLFAITVFLSAFLLFQVQPLIGKYILPWFGGSPAVWTTCLLFFQVGLLGGYAYAHGLIGYVPPRIGTAIHLSFLVAAVAMLPIIPAAHWKPADPDQPILRILLLLTVTVGLPYFVLSATGPLLQAWYAQVSGGRSPYRLYALSNAASLLALVSYPFVFEPALSRATQGWMWSGGLVAFALFCGACALLVWRRGSGVGGEVMKVVRDEAATEAPIAQRGRILWLLLPMAASILLLAVTNKLCQEVAVVPFLWVLPLSIYLLTFVIAFDGPTWYVRPVFAVLLVVAVGTAIVLLLREQADTPIILRTILYATVLFIGCLVCHGEVYRLRPHPSRLTGFYLMIAAGGMLGGLFVGIVAPLVFSGYHEMHVGVLAIWVVALAAYRQDPTWVLGSGSARMTWISLVIFTIVLSLMLGWNALAPNRASITRERSFYGVIRVDHRSDSDGEYRSLVHGSVIHGKQWLRADLRRHPTTYYGPDSGVGRAMRALATPEAKPAHVGVVGLGTGTLAAYGRAGDKLRFYEIDPLVERVAGRYFTFLADSPADVQVVLGDARLSLERESAQDFDLLVLDAFSSDAIPVHLLTREAFELYLRHLAPDGLLAVHISNQHLDLVPIMAGAAEHLGLVGVSLSFNPAEGDDQQFPSRWVLLARDESPLQIPELSDADSLPRDRSVLWTDDWSDLFGLLR